MTFKRPQIMGILNVTPDSFSDGGQYLDPEIAVKTALKLIEDGADIIDIGGESTRPGAETVSVKDELARTIPVITALRLALRDHEVEPLISIDTRKSTVAQAAIHAGADIWNDVSALAYEAHSLSVAAELACPLILMHAQGTPDIMQDNPHYEDSVRDITAFFKTRLAACEDAGIDPSVITLDPGIGFGKRLEDNLALLHQLSNFSALGCPLLIGTSRKSFIGALDGSPVEDRLGGSLASALWAAQQGVSIIRVHDVAATRQALIIWEAIQNSTASGVNLGR